MTAQEWTSRDIVAVILAHNRPAELAKCVDAISHQVGGIVIVDDHSTPPVHADPAWTVGGGAWVRVTVPDRDGELPNLAANVNHGIRLAISVPPREPRDIAVLCDDAIAPHGWVDAVTATMDATGATLGCSGLSHHSGVTPPYVLKTAPDADIYQRLVGWAYILRRHGHGVWLDDDLRCDRGMWLDEDLRWWFQDTDLDWRCRRLGGMVRISGYPVSNLDENGYTNARPDLAEQAGRDREAFRLKWGWAPW